MHTLELRAHAHHRAADEAPSGVLRDASPAVARGVPVRAVRAQRDPGGPVTSVEQADAWIGRIGVDGAGRKIGRITRVWIDDYSGLPTWATLERGRFDRREGVAPLSDVTATGRRLRLACTRAAVRSAPRLDDDGHLGLDDEWRLINHYRLVGPPDPIRPALTGEPSRSMPWMPASSGNPLGSLAPGPGSASSSTPAAQGQGHDQRAEQGASSGRVFLPGMRRRLGLG